MGNITSLQNPDPQIKSLQALNKKLEYEKSEQLRLEHIPVSYTHLTLPTILRV